MKTVSFAAKDNLYQICRDLCFCRRDFYKENMDIIEQHGAIVKLDYLFYCNFKYGKHLDLNKRNRLIICACIYPATYSKCRAEKTYTSQCYYSNVGIIKKANNGTYQLCLNEHEDKGMTVFFKRYSDRLAKEPAHIALKHRFSDVIVNALLPKRPKSSFHKTFRGFPISAIIVIVILLILLCFRLATPTGYHPSLK